VSQTRRVNARLAAVIAEAGWTHAQVARAFVRVALESEAGEFAAVGRSHVSHWVGGSTPSGRAPVILCEALSRRLGRLVNPDEVGLAVGPWSSCGALDWRRDTLAALADLGRFDVDPERRRVLGAVVYSLTALALPSEPWWREMVGCGSTRSTAGACNVGRSDVDAVRMSRIS